MDGSGLDRVEQADAARVAAALKLGVQERLDDALGQIRTRDARPEGEHVRVVVAAGHLGGQAVAAEGAADALDLVRGDGDADAGRADDDAAVTLAGGDAAGDLLAVDGIVDALRAVAAEVLIVDLVLLEPDQDVLLEQVAAVVAADRNFNSRVSPLRIYRGRKSGLPFWNVVK